METVFPYLIFFLQVDADTEINGSFFFWKDFIPTSRKGFLSSGNCFLLFSASFLQVETVSETS